MRSVSQLTVIIDHKQKTARFSGPGTFAAKDIIKSLGSAKWLGNLKTWEISQFATPLVELELLFPEITIEELNSDAVTAIETSATVVASNSNIPTGISVSALMGKVRSVLLAAFPQTIFVYGVISSVKERGDQAFIDLAEQNKPTEKIHCVIWDNLAAHVKQINAAGFNLEPDLEVMFEVKVGFNARSASLSLTVVRIVAEYTTAKLAAERDKTNARLKEEGIFANNKQQKLPFLPKRLGILTSSGGTVINDFRAALDVAEFGFELFWLPVTVQGSDARREIVRGIEKLAQENLDAILIFRGGGSKAELAVFNDYQVAKAVCLCPLPVVSAIGHQEDQSSVQDVSCIVLGVPKDIGRFFADIVLNFREQVASSIQQIKTLGARQVDVAKRELMIYCQTLQKTSDNVIRRSLLDVDALLLQLAGSGGRLLVFWQQQLARAADQIEHRCQRISERGQERLKQMVSCCVAAGNLLSTMQLRIHNFEEILQHVGPETQMKRGFALVRDKNNTYVNSASGLQAGQVVDVVFYDGLAHAEVKDIRIEKEEIV